VSASRAPRILVIGDLGGLRTDHAGDEAMFAANVDLLTRELPAAEITALSRDPEATTRRHGVAALPPIGFPADTAAARERIAAVLAAADGAAPPDAATADVLAALARADALLISGGGNLNSTWPEHLFERLALLHLAERWGKRRLLVGQTLGPHFEEAERNRLAGLLRSAQLVGVRERASFELAALWRVPTATLHDQLDDAALLTGEVPADLVLPAEAFVAVTFAGGLDAIEPAARALSAIARGTGAPLVFIPHAAEPDGDERLAHRLAGQIPQAGLVLSVLAPRAVAAVTRRAALVVSGRYHPLVFGLAGGVPAVGVHFDEYTRVKVRGALGRAGLDGWCLPAALAWEGGLEAAALEAWAAREQVAAHLGAGRAAWQRAQTEHGRRVVAALCGEADEPAGSVDLPPGPQPTGSWTRIARAWTEQAERGRRERQQLAYFRDVAADYARHLETELAAARTEPRR
jgi:polysaccharide pyruvyl transferase WcaK-like protein